MVHDPAVLHVLGVARELLPVQGHVVAAVDLRRDADAVQGLHHRAAEGGEVKLGGVPRVGNKGEIDVAHIVVDRAAPREPPDHVDIVLLHIGGVDLRQSVLVLAYNDGVVVLPKHEIVVGLVQLVKDILFQSQVEVGVVAGTFNVVHHGGFPLSVRSWDG